MNSILKSLLVLLLPLSVSAQSLIAIVDSGTDFEHEALNGRAWINEKEVAGNLVDDDRNGKVDDVNGWNFPDGSGRLFVRDHLDSVHPVTFRLFRIIANLQGGQLSDEEKSFWEANVTSLSQPQRLALLNHLNFYGQYAHGTHVAGVASQVAPDSKILVGRMFPDEPVRNYTHPVSVGFQPLGVVDFLYGLLANLTNATFDQAATYLRDQKADVANYSLGVGLQMIAKQSLILRGTKEPTADELSAETHRLFKQYEPKGKAWMASASETLFVIAAGNDGTDNDRLPIYPGSVRAENAITVAATNGRSSLAEFSNFGATSVDIAAPGVSIVAAVPSLDRREVLPMSGTSMAAPYVTGVAGQLKNLNPELTASELRRILMETVDKKDWLTGKVISGGIVNAERAYQAAELSRRMPVIEAIELSLIQSKDLPETAPSAPQLQSTAPVEMQEWARKLVF